MFEIKGWKDAAIIILGLIVIGMATSRYGADSNMVNYFSFGSTLISIVLSIIAILYTLWTSIVATTQLDKLHETANRFRAVADDFHQLRAQIQLAVESAVKEQIAPVHAGLRGLSEQLASTKETTGPLHHSETDVQRALEAVSPSGLMLLYLGLREGTQPFRRSLEDLLVRLNDQPSDANLSIPYAVGYLVGFTSTGLIRGIVQPSDLTAFGLDMPVDLQRAVTSAVESAARSSPYVARVKAAIDKLYA